MSLSINLDNGSLFLFDFELCSPECLPLEVANSLAKWIKRKVITYEQGIKCFELFQKIPIKLIEVDFNNALRYAAEENQYVYDMFYLDLAIKTGKSLLTIDKYLFEIASNRGVVCL